MTEIKRYRPEGGHSHDLSYGYMEEDAGGEYMKWVDYERTMLRLRDGMRAVYRTTRLSIDTGEFQSTPDTEAAYKAICSILRESGFEVGFREPSHTNQEEGA